MCDWQRASVYIHVFLRTVYQLQQEAPRPKRITCPQEVSTTCMSVNSRPPLWHIRCFFSICKSSRKTAVLLYLIPLRFFFCIRFDLIGKICNFSQTQTAGVILILQIKFHLTAPHRITCRLHFFFSLKALSLFPPSAFPL